MSKFKIHTCGPRSQAPKGSLVINTTSRSTDFGRAFSPFLNQGWIELGGLRSHNVENLWQFTKVYKRHTDDFEKWKEWRNEGLSDKYPHRYPMGKGTVPECSFWGGKKMGYLEARKHIYFPAYKQKLERYCQREVNSLLDMLTVSDIWLWDFDGYTTDDDWETISTNEERPMGHAFVIKHEICKLRGERW